MPVARPADAIGGDGTTRCPLYSRSVVEGTRTIDLPVGLNAVYDTVAAVDAYPAWQSIVGELEILERDADGRALLVATAFATGPVTLRLVLRYAYDPPHTVRCMLERGDVKDLRSTWTLQGDAGATQAAYHVEVDPGRRLGLLLRGGVADRLRAKVVDGTVEDLRRHLAG
jgi:ribosome-associated toxin RatA of RatAB toxin-antitoxin module